MIAYQAHLIGADELVKEFAYHATWVPEAVNSQVRRHGQLLNTKVKARASGRPGPNAPTGDYRRSITLELITTPFASYAAVGTNKPQGRRLEFGFTGADSLGRIYDQPPYPHFGPAFDEVAPMFTLSIEGIVRKL